MHVDTERAKKSGHVGSCCSRRQEAIKALGKLGELIVRLVGWPWVEQVEEGLIALRGGSKRLCCGSVGLGRFCGEYF